MRKDMEVRIRGLERHVIFFFSKGKSAKGRKNSKRIKISHEIERLMLGL